MKRKVKFGALSALALAGCMCLSSCDEGNSYDVVWKNWDGTVLELDTGVGKGSMAQYNSTTPTRKDDNNYKYSFAGWDKEVGRVTGDTTYTAVYNNIDYDYSIEIDYNDGKTPNGIFKFDEANLDNSYDFSEIFYLNKHKEKPIKYDWKLDDGSLISGDAVVKQAVKNGNKKFTAKYYVEVETVYYIESNDLVGDTYLSDLPELFGTINFPEKKYLDEDYVVDFDLSNNSNILGYEIRYNDSVITSINDFNSEFEDDTHIKVFINVKSYQLHVSNNVGSSNNLVMGYIYNYLNADVEAIDYKIQWGTPVTLNTTYDEYEFDGYYDENDNLLSNERLYTFILTESTNIVAKWKVCK